MIEDGAFSGCKKLHSVVTGASLSKIGKNVFANDKSLKIIDLRNSKTLKSVGSGTFKGISKKEMIKVPKGKIKAYKKLLKINVGNVWIVKPSFWFHQMHKFRMMCTG